MESCISMTMTLHWQRRNDHELPCRGDELWAVAPLSTRGVAWSLLDWRMEASSTTGWLPHWKATDLGLRPGLRPLKGCLISKILIDTLILISFKIFSSTLIRQYVNLRCMFLISTRGTAFGHPPACFGNSCWLWVSSDAMSGAGGVHWQQCLLIGKGLFARHLSSL